MKTAAVIAVCSAVIAGSFFVGRTRERVWPGVRPEIKPVPNVVADHPVPTAAYAQLSIQQLLSAPLPEFYEALRDAPREAYTLWSEQLQNLPDDGRRTAAARGFYKLLVQFDPAFAAAAIEKIPPGSGLRTTAAAVAINAVPPSGMKEVAAMLTRLPADVWKNEEYDPMGKLLTRWAEVDPEGVVRFCDAHPDSQSKIGVGTIAYYWAALDPYSAQNWLSRQDTSEDETVVTSFAAGMWLYDHETAATYVKSHLSEAGMIDAASTIAAMYFAESDIQAKEYVDSLPAGPARRGAIEEIAASASFIAEREGEPTRVPAYVAKWLLQFPQDDWEGSMSKVIGEWGQAAPEEVIRWIREQPDEAQSAIVAEYRLPILDEEQERSYREIFQIPDKRMRDEFVIALLKHEQEQGVVISHEIARLPFTEEEKQAIAARVAAKTPSAEVLEDTEQPPGR